MKNDFIKTSLENKTGCCTCAISLKRNGKEHKKRLKFYLVYLKEEDYLYVISLDFSSMKTIPCWSIIEKERNLNKIVSSVSGAVSYLVEMYASFYQENNESIQTFEKCISKRLLISFYLMRIKFLIRKFSMRRKEVINTKHDLYTERYNDVCLI